MTDPHPILPHPHKSGSGRAERGVRSGQGGTQVSGSKAGNHALELGPARLKLWRQGEQGR